MKTDSRLVKRLLLAGLTLCTAAVLTTGLLGCEDSDFAFGIDNSAFSAGGNAAGGYSAGVSGSEVSGSEVSGSSAPGAGVTGAAGQSSGGGCTGFFSGCGGKSCSDNSFTLTDDVEGGEQPAGSIDREVVAQPAVWDVQPDEASYLAMMEEKTRVYLDYIAQMAELQPTLAKARTANAVRSNERYAALENALLQWSNAALDYPESGLDSADASSVRTLSCMLADSTVKWLQVYPETVCGENPDTSEADALLDSIMDSAMQLSAYFEQ